MKHLTTSSGTSYVCTFQDDVGNDLGLEVSSLYYFDNTAGKYIKSDRDLVNVINDAVETHDIPKSRIEES